MATSYYKLDIEIENLLVKNQQKQSEEMARSQVHYILKEMNLRVLP